MGPSGKSPTVAERKWMDAAREFGCVACAADGHPNTPALIHHLVEGNRRLGHRFTIGLCQDHHMPDSRSGKVSIHPGRSPRFIAIYGTERELLAWLEKKLGFDPA